VQKALPLFNDGSSILLNASSAGSRAPRRSWRPMPAASSSGTELFVDGGSGQI
jgi:hypothetical protein